MSSSVQSGASPSGQDPTEYLKTAQFSRSESATPLDNANVITAQDLLMGQYDPTKLHPYADLSDKLDYLTLDDEKINEIPGSGTAIPSRGWSDDLCYGTGTMYLSGKWISFMLLFLPPVFASCLIHSLIPLTRYLNILRDPTQLSLSIFYCLPAVTHSP